MNHVNNTARQSLRALCISMLLWSGVAMSSAGVTQDEALRLRQSGKIQALEHIITKAQAQHAGTILEAELNKEGGGYVYEVEILDANGAVWEMRFNARTGELLNTKKEH